MLHPLLIRSVLGFGGGYLLALCFTIAVGVLLAQFAGVPRADAAVLAGMLSFLVWTMALLVAFAASSTARATAWIVGSIALLCLVIMLGNLTFYT